MDYATLDVIVTPRANCTRVYWDNGIVRVRVPCPPSDGEANRAVCEAIAKSLHIAKSNVMIIRGHKSRQKTVCVRGLKPQDVLTKLRQLSQTPD